MKTNQKRSGMYFNIEDFIDMILREVKMDKASPEVMAELKMEIGRTVSDRVTSTIITSLGEKELFLMNKTMEDHPELDEIDYLSIITSYVPGLDQKILKAVDDLYEEMIENVKKIDLALAKAK
jgi:hypothetical protein